MQSNNPGQLNWGAISQAIAAGVIPAPIASDENGMPIWEIEGKRITWQQVQQFVWQRLQSAPKATPGSLESGPQIQFSEMPFANLEARLEQRLEQSGENKPEQGKQQFVQQPKVQSSPTLPVPEAKVKLAKAIGRSAALQSVDPTDPISMNNFAQQHNSDAPNKSSRFLAEFLERILKIVTVEAA